MGSYGFWVGELRIFGVRGKVGKGGGGVMELNCFFCMDVCTRRYYVEYLLQGVLLVGGPAV